MTRIYKYMHDMTIEDINKRQVIAIAQTLPDDKGYDCALIIKNLNEDQVDAIFKVLPENKTCMCTARQLLPDDRKDF